ncbi:MAG: penicillin-binding protein 2 [Alphaproteobacteria bacterium]|nr:penicillin-binding protein 2 [Alphaproteobacteria bacterium]
MRQQAYQKTVQRILGIAFFKAFLLLVIMGRLYVLQVFYSDRYATLSDDNRIRTRFIFPQRGEIFDRHHRLLAQNVQNYSAILIPEDAENLEQTLKTLQIVLKLNQEDMTAIRKSIKQRPKFFPTVIRDDLSWNQLARLEVNMLSLPGIYIEHGFKRQYPLGKIGAHVIGYVSAPSALEAQGNKALMMPGAKIGKSAIESFYEDHLKGVSGQKDMEVDARGRLVRELKYVSPIPGNDLHLTLDEDLQRAMAEVFEEQKVESGAAVVLNSNTGEVLGLISVPGFNPELFYHGIDLENWNALLKDPYKPMTNKAISGLYSPASIFKIIVALAALQTGHSLHEEHSCPGYYRLGNHRFHCWRKEGHGRVNLYQAIVRSCDVYFYHLAAKIGEKPILELAKLFGLKDITGIDLPNEAGGFLADPDWKKRVRKEQWRMADTILTAIGQAYILSTPLQMAVMMAQVVNGGYKIKPTLLKGQNEATPLEKIEIDQDSVSILQKALVDVVNSPGGTSYHTRIREEKYAMGGKTGTAQVRRISMQERQQGGRKDAAIPWHLRDNALFVGFAPTHAPQYVVAVIAEHKGFGGMVAAPIASKILKKTQEVMERK